MANTTKGNVLIVDTSDFFDFTLVIKAVKLFGGAETSSVTIQADGTVVYRLDVTACASRLEEVPLRINKSRTPFVDVTGGGTAYIYLA